MKMTQTSLIKSSLVSFCSWNFYLTDVFIYKVLNLSISDYHISFIMFTFLGLLFYTLGNIIFGPLFLFLNLSHSLRLLEVRVICNKIKTFCV